MYQMNSTRYRIAGKTFSSKKDVINYIRKDILYAYGDYQALETEHHNFMLHLLRLHPHGNQKIGQGVKSIWPQSNKANGFPTRGFWVERVDGSRTDFSYLQCLNPSSPKQDFYKACRQAIAEDIIQFSMEYFSRYAVEDKIQCPITGDWITKRESHVDHIPPDTFDQIVRAFIETNNIDTDKVALMRHVNGKIGCRFDDGLLVEKWIKYHRNHAKLRVVSRKANLSLIKKEHFGDEGIGNV